MNLLFPSSIPLAPDRRLPEDRRRVPVIGWRIWKLRQAAEVAALESLFQERALGGRRHPRQVSPLPSLAARQPLRGADRVLPVRPVRLQQRC
jgi:hypothetical protein